MTLNSAVKVLVVGGLFLVSAAQAATVTVHINAGRFVPDQMQIHVGDTVEFVNDTRGVHTVTADSSLVRDPANVVLPAGAKPFNSGAIAPGAKFSHVFDVAGQYGYVCLPHERMGMVAGIDVVQAE